MRAAAEKVCLEIYNDQNTMTYGPPTRAPYEPGDVTTCVPSDSYVLGVTRRPSVACSAST